MVENLEVGVVGVDSVVDWVLVGMVLDCETRSAGDVNGEGYGLGYGRCVLLKMLEGE